MLCLPNICIFFLFIDVHIYGRIRFFSAKILKLKFHIIFQLNPLHLLHILKYATNIQIPFFRNAHHPLKKVSRFADVNNEIRYLY